MSGNDMTKSKPSAGGSLGFRTLCAVSAILIALIFLGCMSLSIGEHKHLPGEATTGVLTQEGTILLQPGSEQTVYYPIPYAQPPNLELEDEHNVHQYCVVQEQKPDLFRISYPQPHHKGYITVTWKARGVRVPAPSVATPAPASSSELPPAPVPVP